MTGIHENHRLRIASFASLCLILFPLAGCAVNLDPSDEKIVYCINDQYSVYSKVVSQILPDYAVERDGNNAFGHLEKGAVTEAFATQAFAAIETGLAKYWYPQYLATVIIAVDRDLTDVQINSWSDLPGSGEKAGHIMAPHLNNEMTLSAMSYGLEGEAFSLKTAGKILGALNKEKRYGRNDYEAPILICYDYYAAEMIKDGRNLEIIVPSEGTFTYEKGLLSNTELVFAGDVDSTLLSAGFRLLDGRCDNTLYPGTQAYENAAAISDYAYLNTVALDATLVFRRSIMGTHMYTSVDGREHMYFVLIFLIILVIWVAWLMNRLANKNMRKTVLWAGILMLGWMLIRLISYQLNVSTDLRRYIGYTYYLFQLSLPITFFWLAHIIGKPDEKTPIPLWIKVFAAYMFALIALVYTNDLHSWVYIYDFSNPNWGNEYGYGFVYNLLTISWVISLVAVFILLLIKSKGYIRKTGIVFPLLLMVLVAAYQYGYQNNIPIARESDKTMVICVFILLFAESLIQTGMIPVNTKYRSLFTHSPLGMRIMGSAYDPVLSSALAVQADCKTITSAVESYPLPSHLGDNMLLFAAPITGGYALWQEDISDLNRLQKEIEDSVSKLKAANSMLVQEEKIKRTAQEENDKTQLLAQLETEISEYTIKLATMIEQLEYAVDKPKATARIALLLCYVKRRCNLFFREREVDILPADELTVYLDELAEIAGYSDVRIIITNELKTPVSVRRVTLFYDLFYSVIYWASWLDNPNILAHIGVENENVALRLLPSDDARLYQMGRALEKAVNQAGGIFSVKDLDDAAGLSLSFTEGGEKNG